MNFSSNDSFIQFLASQSILQVSRKGKSIQKELGAPAPFLYLLNFFFYRNTFCNPIMTLYLMTWRCKYTHCLMFYFHKCKIYRCPCFFFVCRFLQIGNNCDLDSSNCDLCLHCKIKLDSTFPPSSPSLFCAPSTFAHQRFWLFFGCYVFLAPALSWV